MTQPQSQAPATDLASQATQFGPTVSTPGAPAPGRFVWHDLMSTDTTRTTDFYTKLFGWTTSQMDMGPAGTYTMFHSGDKPIGGTVPLGPEPGMPSHWMCYVTVRNVDAAVEQAVALGGQAPFPGQDIPEVGRFAVIADPTGAHISPFTFAPGTEPPEGGEVPVGQFCWYELLTKDAEAAARFYDDVFGWTHRTQDMGEFGTYYLFDRGGQEIAGALPMPPGSGAPPMWLPYIRVEDVDQSAARLTELGGRVYRAPADIPNVGRFAVCADPTGAAIALYKPLQR